MRLSERLILGKNGECLICHGDKKCIDCKGSGRHPDPGINALCPTCKGNGKCLCQQVDLLRVS